MAQGEIAVLIVKDANPAFTLPARAAFAEALGKVPFVVSLEPHGRDHRAGPPDHP